jgi:hypothetical protein
VSDQVAVAIITTVGVVLAALIGVQSRQIGAIRRDARAARAQLDNDHTTDPGKTSNLREDLDEKHGAVLQTVRSLVVIVNMLRRDVGGMRQDVRQLRTDLSGTQDRVHDLENTQDRERIIREQQQRPE